MILIKFLLASLSMFQVSHGLIQSSEYQYETVTEKSAMIIELFTSQGCSSCPSADKLLSEIKQTHNSSDVIVLSYHVDYWNRLGWKDPFSKNEFSDLQYQYAKKFKSRSVYTPQAVVNGITHFVGSDRGEMKSSISNRPGSFTNAITLNTIHRTGNKVEASFNIQGDISKQQLVANLVIGERITEVQSGENRSRKLENHNIVVEQIKIDLDKKQGNFQILIPEVVEKYDELFIVAFTRDMSLNINGAAISPIK